MFLRDALASPVNPKESQGLPPLARTPAPPGEALCRDDTSWSHIGDFPFQGTNPQMGFLTFSTQKVNNPGSKVIVSS